MLRSSWRLRWNGGGPSTPYNLQAEGMYGRDLLERRLGCVRVGDYPPGKN